MHMTEKLACPSLWEETGLNTCIKWMSCEINFLINSKLFPLEWYVVFFSRRYPWTHRKFSFLIPNNSLLWDTAFKQNLEIEHSRGFMDPLLKFVDHVSKGKGSSTLTMITAQISLQVNLASDRLVGTKLWSDPTHIKASTYTEFRKTQCKCYNGPWFRLDTH